MIGTDAQTGRRIDGEARLTQALRTIFTTSRGSLVMLRGFGSEVPRVLDQPINQFTLIDVFMAVAEGFEWEPEVELQRVQVVEAGPGWAEIMLELGGPDGVEELLVRLGGEGDGARTGAAGSALDAPDDLTAPPVLDAALVSASGTTAWLTVTAWTGRGTLHVVATGSATPPRPTQVVAGQDHTGADAVAASAQITGAGMQGVTVTGLPYSATLFLHAVQDDAAGKLSAVVTAGPFTTPDTTAPILSALVAVADGFDAADLSVDTDESGTVIVVLSTDPTAPDGDQVQAGQDHTGAAAASATTVAAEPGTVAIRIEELDAETTYYAHAVQTDAAGNRSAVLTGDAFTTGAAPFTLPATVVSAHSVARRLDPAYSGPLIRVRRGSDNSELDIGFDGDGKLDEAALLAHTGTGWTDTGFIVTVFEQSGDADAVDYGQTTAAKQPQIVAAGAVVKRDGHPAMHQISGTSINMGDAWVTRPASATILEVWEHAAENNITHLSTSDGSGNPIWVEAQSGSALAVISAGSGDPEIYKNRAFVAQQGDGTTRGELHTALAVDELIAFKALDGSLANAQFDALATGYRDGGQDGPTYWCEQIILSAPSAADVAATETDQATFYGITLT